MLSPLNKFLIALLIVVSLGALGFIVYKTHEMSQMQSDIQKSVMVQKQLMDDITRSQSQYASKSDMEALAKSNGIALDDIKKDLNSIGGQITGVNVVSVASTENKQTNLPSSSTTANKNPVVNPTVQCDGKSIPCPNSDKYGYLQNQQNLQLNESFNSNKTQVPIGQVSFDASSDKPWSYDLYARQYRLVNVLSTNQDGAQTVYNKFSIEVNGKTFPIDINNAQFEQEYPTASFSFWNPRLMLGISSSLGVSRLPLQGMLTPTLSLGIMSYGKTKIQPDFSFLEVGIGYEAVGKNLAVEIAPVGYNIGKNLTVIRNTYIAPVLDLTTNGNVGIGLGLRVAL